ncbi:hypothetical protein JCM5296_004454 [Sporobolomyces johnsonii]
MSHSPSLAPPTRDPRRRPGSTSTGTSTSASAVGPPEPRASKIAREAREAAQPYRKEPDPPSSRHPTDSNQLWCEGCKKWLPKQQFTDAQVQKVSGRGKRKQWSRPVKYAKCQHCIVHQQLEIKCLEERVFGSSDDEPDDETLEKLHEAKFAPGGGYGGDDASDDYDE